MRAFLSKLAKRFTEGVRAGTRIKVSQVLTFASAGLLAYGTALVFVPAGIMVGAFLLFLIAVDMR